jgi:predicted HicB family RNase H-like nuclease
MPRRNLSDYGLGENQDLSNCKQEELDFVFQNSYSPWKESEPEEREPKVKLNVVINKDLNNRLTEKAKKLNKSKTELVRVLLDRALDE